ncbi:hypothetical protein ANCDUO_25036, partial [Ancylostoma duodenale]
AVSTDSEYQAAVQCYRSVLEASAHPPFAAPHHQPLLMIVRAYALDHRTGSWKPVSILPDSGAQTSFITSATVSRLSLYPCDTRTLTTVSFGGHRVHEETALVDVELFDHSDQPFKVLYWHIRVSVQRSPVSRFFVNAAQVIDHLSAERSVDSVSRLWDLDLLGITDDPDPSVDKDEDARVLCRFQNTAEEIGESISFLDYKAFTLEGLRSYLHDYLKQGIIEEVDEFKFDDHRVYYIPHQANTYVDNVILSANTPEEAIAKYRESKSLFASMHMNLREFLCNSAVVNSAISPSDRIRNASTVKLLGIPWKPDLDNLVVPLKIVHQPVSTKRTALRALSSTFDPLGLLVPFLAPFKVFIQDTWKKKYQWDDPLDEEDLL